MDRNFAELRRAAACKGPFDGQRTDLWFGAARDAPLLVFHHIPKTAGTSLKRVIAAHAPGVKHVALDSPRDGGHPARPELPAWYENVWRALGAQQRRRLVGVASHSANFLLPVVDRTTLAVTLLRDPVDRVLSYYYFLKRNGGSAPPGAGKLIVKRPVKAIFRRFGGCAPGDSPAHRFYAQFFNGQARSLLDPYCDTGALAFSAGPSTDADAWRERVTGALAAYDIVGRNARLGSTVRAIERRLGWAAVRPLPYAKFNHARPRGAVDGELAALIRSFNWLDQELYDAIERA